MFKPLNNRIVVLPDEVKEKTTGTGLILAEKNQEKPVTGTVVRGNDTLAEGTRVLFSKFGYDEFTHEDRVYYVVSTDLILGVFE